MRIIVVGASRLGFAIVDQLLDDDHDVVLVDNRRERLNDIAERLDCGFIGGDGTLPQTLRDAYGDGAEVLMLMTNHDDVNILGAVVGKSVGFERVILQIVRAELLDVCEELGLEEVITPHRTVARSVVRSVEGNANAAQETNAMGSVNCAKFGVPESLEGDTLAGLKLPDGVRAIAVLRDTGEPMLDGETVLESNDRLLVAITENAEGEIEKILGERLNA